MKKVFAILAIGYMIGLGSGIFIYEVSLNFAWRQYQVCADQLATEKQRAIDEASKNLEKWASDKLVIDGDQFAKAILRTTEQFNLHYYSNDGSK